MSAQSINRPPCLTLPTALHTSLQAAALKSCSLHPLVQILLARTPSTPVCAQPQLAHLHADGDDVGQVRLQQWGRALHELQQHLTGQDRRLLMTWGLEGLGRGLQRW